MRLVLAGLSFLVFLSACSSSQPLLQSSGPWNPEDAKVPLDGFRYHLAQQKIMVQASITTTTSKIINDDLTTGEQKSTVKNVNLDIVARTVPDLTNVYVLKFTPRKSRDKTLNFAISDEGLLTSINSNDIDRKGEIIVNITKSIGSVAGAVIGGAFKGFAVGVDDREIRKVFDSTAYGKFLLERKTKNPKDPIFEKEYNDKYQEFLLLPLHQIKFIGEERGKKLWDQRVAAENSLVNLQNKRDSIYIEASKSPSLDVSKLKVAQADALNLAIGTLAEKRDKVAIAFEASLSKFMQENGLSDSTNVEKYTFTFDMKDFPSEEKLNTGKYDSFDEELKKFPKMVAFYKITNRVITIDGHPKYPVGYNPNAPDGKTITHIYYRQAAPLNLKVNSLIHDMRNGIVKFVTESDEVKPLIVENPILHLSYDEKAFSNNNVSLTFNKQGALVGLSQGATSSLASMASASAGSISALKDEFSGTFSKTLELRQAKHNYELNRLTNSVDMLKKKKEEIDARLDLEGATASQALIAEKKQIDAQLNLLQSQVNLAKETGTSDYAVDNAQLKAQIEYLQNEINLIKVRSELNGLQPKN